jgi:endonuclease/exonuclease/phosphatase family metal-dependent hydrolase
MGQTQTQVTHFERPSIEPHLRVMSWNIHKGVGGLDRRYDLNRTIAVIKHYSPDVLLLQEVAQGIKRLRGHDQVDLLTAALGLHASFHLEHQRRVGAYGNLILARWPIYHSTHLDLTIGWRKRRGMLQAHIRTHVAHFQRSLVVHNMHLGLAGSERGKQLERFVSSAPLRQVSHNTPTIVAGDFNDLWGSLGPKYLLPFGFERAGALANTFPSALPLRPLDGLFYRGGLKLVHCAVARSELARTASDHLPIYADFILLPA